MSAHRYALFILTFLASCSTPPSSIDEGRESGRGLDLAFVEGEVAVKILLNGSPLTDPSIASQLEVVITNEGDEYQGSDDNKTIEKNPSGLDQVVDVQPCSSCQGNSYFQDRWDTSDALDDHIGEVVDGNYKLELRKKIDDQVISTAFIAVNHGNWVPTASNGTFLDITADQTVTFRINSSLEQTGQPSIDFPHQRGEPHLSATIIRPSTGDTTIYVNQVLSVLGQASNGLTCCAKKFAWDWNASAGDTETFNTEFSTSSTADVSYTSAGPRKIRLLVRDGNDNASSSPRGGHYAMSSAKTVTVLAGDAQSVSNTIPSQVTTGTFYATSVTMKNTGPNTWTSAAGFKLGQAQNGTWLPSQVNLASSVSPNTNVTFNFNLKHVEPEVLGNNACFWQMKLGGTFFGQQNGKTVWVNGSGFSAQESFLERLVAWMAPPEASAANLNGLGLQGQEIVQELRIRNQKLNARDVEAAGRYVLRYEAALEEDWNVDFYFHVEFDEEAFKVGTPVRGPRGINHSVEVNFPAPGEVIVKAARTGTAGLSGTGLILEVPFVLHPGAGAPETLALVELVATR